MNEINVNTIEKIQSQYKNKTESQFFYNQYVKVLENLKNRLSDFKEPEKIQKVNEILKNLEYNREFSIISKQIKELEKLLAGYEADKINIKQWTSKNLDSFQKLWMKLEQEAKEKEEVESEKKSSETSLNLDNFEEKLRKIVLSWEVDRDQLDQKIDEILSNSEFKDYSEKDKKIVKENILAITEQKTLDLSKLDKMIDWLYDPKNPKVIKFLNPQTWKTETIEFASEQEVKNFLYNLKQYAKGELENSYFDDWSEWFLPGTSLRTQNSQVEFYAEAIFYGAISLVLLDMGVWAFRKKWPILWVQESITRRWWDFTWRWSNSDVKTFPSEVRSAYNQTLAWWILDGSYKTDLQKLQARDDIYEILKLKWDTLVWDEKVKFLGKLEEIHSKYFYSKSNTYLYKMYWLLNDKGLAYDARILLTEWMRVVPTFNKSFNPFKWSLLPINSTDTFNWKIWWDKTYVTKINSWHELFYSWTEKNKDNWLYNKEKLTLDANKVDDFELFLRSENVSEEKIKEVKKYIEWLKNNNKSFDEINRVIWLMVKNDKLLHSTDKIKNTIEELEKELNDTKFNILKKSSIDKKIRLLESFRHKVSNHTWIWEKNEFENIIKWIKDWKINKVSDNYYFYNFYTDPINLNQDFMHKNFVKDWIDKAPEINKARAEVLRKLGFNEWLHKFNQELRNYVNYYVPNGEEETLGKKLDNLVTVVADEEWYAKKIAEIFGIKTENKSLDNLINEIRNEISKINIEPSYLLERNLDFWEPPIKLNSVKDNIINEYKIWDLKNIVLDKEYKKILIEIEKLSRSIVNWNKYLVWQISYIIDWIVDWKKFDDLGNIDWRTIQIDNSKMESKKVIKKIEEHNKQRIELENKQAEIQNEKEEIKKFNDSEVKKISEIDEKIDELRKLTNEKDISEFIGDNELSKKYWVSPLLVDSNSDLKTQTLNYLNFVKEVELRLDKTLELSWLPDDEIRKIWDEIVNKKFYTKDGLNNFLSEKTNWNISKLLTEAEILDKLKLKIDSLWLTWLKADIQGNKVILKNEKGEVIKLEEWIVEIKKADEGIAKMFRKVARYF